MGYNTMKYVVWYTESEPRVSSPTAPGDIGGGVGPHNLLRGGLGGGRGQVGLESRNVPEWGIMVRNHLRKPYS